MIRTLVAAGAALIATTAPGQDNWTIGERELPLPGAVSPEFREYLSGLAAPDPNGRPPVPATRDEWIAAVRAIDGQRGADIEAQIPALPLTVTEARIAGVDVHRIVPAEPDPRFADRLFIDLHGGAYVVGNGKAGLNEALVVAERIGIEVLAVDYRMPPLAEPFPAAVDDAVKVYLEVLADRSPDAIAVGGTSAGGGLTLALMHRLKAIGAPAPAALYAGTPWSDLTKTGDSQFANEGIDATLVKYEGFLEESARLYVGVEDWRDPLLSPVYGDFTGFPPTMLVSGTRDLFLSDVVRTHRKLRAAGVEADLHVFEALSHAEYFIASGAPESRETYRELGEFLARHLR